MAAEPANLEAPALAAPELDAFARMVALARQVTGYDPGAEDEPEDELAAARTRRWAGRTVACAALVLLLFNAPSIRSWAGTLPPGWGAETARRLADVWTDRTGAAGLDQPRRSIHAAWRDLRSGCWPAGASNTAQRPPKTGAMTGER